jgi:hypothetical protein
MQPIDFNSAITMPQRRKARNLGILIYMVDYTPAGVTFDASAKPGLMKWSVSACLLLKGTKDQ